ncbi:hypothetical protein G7054_g5768 [Neopestalotiopsis clavispora]|jgi:hypothetical protein|nr:hypothetical protein G7054_g5768 [Neopestalotiopsis clavispora]
MEIQLTSFQDWAKPTSSYRARGRWGLVWKERAEAGQVVGPPRAWESAEEGLMMYYDLQRSRGRDTTGNLPQRSSPEISCSVLGRSYSGFGCQRNAHPQHPREPPPASQALAEDITTQLKITIAINTKIIHNPYGSIEASLYCISSG